MRSTTVTSSPVADDGAVSIPIPAPAGYRGGGRSPPSMNAPIWPLRAGRTGEPGAGRICALISKWRRLRDTGVLEGEEPDRRSGVPRRDEGEIARLRRHLESAEATDEVEVYQIHRDGKSSFRR